MIKAFNYKDVIDSTLLNTENNLQKTETIYKYVSSNITWNGVYSMYASQSNNRIIEKKTGTSGDINLLLISLLKKAGVEVNPVLVRTRNLGRIENMYPVKEQFNHIIAQVIIDDKTLYLDASSGNTQFDKLPWTVNNAVGWVLKRKDYGWTEINNKI
jgi:deoxyhypusine synthase